MTKEQTPPLVSDELALQCKNEADEMYPPHLAPDEVIGDHFMLVRYAVANALYNDRQKTREVVQRLVDALDEMKDAFEMYASCQCDGTGCPVCRKLDKADNALFVAQAINIKSSRP